MISRSIKNIIIIFLIFIYFLIYPFFVYSKSIDIINVFNTSFLLIILFLTYLLFGFRKSRNNYLSSRIFKIVFSYTFITILLTYILGYFIGFNKSIYSYSITSIISNRILPLVIIILIELFRYIVLCSNIDKKKVMFIYVFIIFILDLLLNMKSLQFNESYVSFLSYISILSILIKNLLLSYLCYNAGYKAPIIYRLIIDGFLLILPYYPKLEDIIYLLIYINLPFLIIYTCSREINHWNNTKKEFSKFNFKYIKSFCIIFLIIFIGLVSKLLPHYVVGIKSESMSPNINKGDIVLIEKINKNTKIKRNDIIAYNDNNELIIHRVVDIKTKNNKKYYITKGDNNNVADSNKVFVNDVCGVIKLKIPKLSWPIIWFNEIFKRR